MTTIPITVAMTVCCDCIEFLQVLGGESRERNLADMLDNGQAKIVNVRIEDDAVRQVNLEAGYEAWRKAYGD